MVNNIMRSALLLTLLASISACGFHLRGNIPLSDGVKNLYLSAPVGPFKDKLTNALRGAGANIAATEGGSDAILVVTDASSNRTVGTLDDRGKVNSYNLSFRVEYILSDPAGDAIRPVKTLVETRQYNFDPETVVETEAEEAELLESMEQEISLRILRQLSTITDYKPK